MEREMATQAEIIRAVNAKGYEGSIATAAHYLRDLASAVGKREASMMFGMSSDYRKVCKAAQRRLCLHNHQFDMEVTKAAGGKDADLPDGVSAEILARVTTSDKDWDGDIVHPEGLIFDQKGPLLWMHSQHMPIGTFAGQVTQDEKAAKNRYRLAETDLALDAVKLYRIGALRNSIGFKVLEAEPLGFTDGAGGKQVPTGFDIKRAVVLENSAVAIPANPNAEVEAFYEKQYGALREAYSEKQFNNPIVRKYAGVIYENRPKVFRGAEMETKATSIPDSKVAELAAKPETEQKSTAELETKSVQVAMDDYMKGSYESSIQSVERGVKRYLCDKADCSEESYPYVMSTYADKAYVCMRKWSDGGIKKKCYSVDYKMGDDGAEFTGHKAVKIEPSIMEEVETKGFMDGMTVKEFDAGLIAKYSEPEAESPAETAQPVLDTEHATKILAKCITGEIEMDDKIKELIRQTAALLDTTDRASELSELLV